MHGQTIIIVMKTVWRDSGSLGEGYDRRKQEQPTVSIHNYNLDRFLSFALFYINCNEYAFGAGYNCVKHKVIWGQARKMGRGTLFGDVICNVTNVAPPSRQMVVE